MLVCLKESLLSTAERQLAHPTYALSSEVLCTRLCDMRLNNRAGRGLGLKAITNGLSDPKDLVFTRVMFSETGLRRTDPAFLFCIIA